MTEKNNRQLGERDQLYHQDDCISNYIRNIIFRRNTLENFFDSLLSLCTIHKYIIIIINCRLIMEIINIYKVINI